MYFSFILVSLTKWIQEGNTSRKTMVWCSFNLRPTDADDNEILVLTESDRYKTTWEISENFEINLSTVVRQLRQFEMVSNANLWAPHEFKEKAELLLAIPCWSVIKSIPFWSRLLHNEKWIVCNNVKRKRSCPKRGRTCPFNHRKIQLTF